MLQRACARNVTGGDACDTIGRGQQHGAQRAAWVQCMRNGRVTWVQGVHPVRPTQS